MAFRYRPLDGGVCEDGFIFLRHDAEWSMGFTEYFKSATRGAQLDVTGLGRDFQTFCPSRFHWRLCDHAEYRMLVADRFYRHRELERLTLIIATLCGGRVVVMVFFLLVTGRSDVVK